MITPFWKCSNRILFVLCIFIIVVGISAPVCADTNVKGSTATFKVWAPSHDSPGDRLILRGIPGIGSIRIRDQVPVVKGADRAPGEVDAREVRALLHSSGRCPHRSV